MDDYCEQYKKELVKAKSVCRENHLVSQRMKLAILNNPKLDENQKTLRIAMMMMVEAYIWEQKQQAT